MGEVALSETILNWGLRKTKRVDVLWVFLLGRIIASMTWTQGSPESLLLHLRDDSVAHGGKHPALAGR